VTGTVALQGRGASPDPRWQVPVTVAFQSEDGSSTLFTRQVVTSDSGAFSVSNIAPGTYRLKVKHAQSLSRRTPPLVLIAGTNGPFGFGLLPTGDVDNNDLVDIVDFSVL
jgi:hypothetical protein